MKQLVLTFLAATPAAASTTIPVRFCNFTVYDIEYAFQEQYIITSEIPYDPWRSVGWFQLDSDSCRIHRITVHTDEGDIFGESPLGYFARTTGEEELWLGYSSPRWSEWETYTRICTMPAESSFSQDSRLCQDAPEGSGYVWADGRVKGIDTNPADRDDPDGGVEHIDFLNRNFYKPEN